MKNLLSALLILTSFVCKAQVFTPKWVVLEKGNSVGIVKPGANDVLSYMGGSQKNMDRDAFREINDGINFVPGSVVFIYDKVGDLFLGGDIEGRTLLVRGVLTPAEHKEGSGPAYVRDPIAVGSMSVPQGIYVWIKKRNPAKGTLTIQYAGRETLELPADKFFIINETTAELATSVIFKPIQ